MATEHIFLNDIISDHRERMLNIKKYYPFFKLCDISFSQFKDGKYQVLDMGYIVMAILRFFIEENNFKEKDVTYVEFVAFVSQCVRRDFAMELTADEYKEIADFVFDKIKNDGRPFDFEYFDPVDRKKRISRMKVIESRIIDNTVWYSISADAIEFYLDTKEIKDESRISVQQLLLEKMINAQDFGGGTQVIARINEEVNRLLQKKNEVLNILSADVYAGMDAYDEFVDTGMRWFDDEEKLFVKNMELIEAARKRAEENQSVAPRTQAITQIYELENQLKIAINKHSELLRACTDMQKMTDDIVRRAKLSRFRSHLDFAGALKDMIETDNADFMSMIIAPLLKPHATKTFYLKNIDECLNVKSGRYEKAEKISREPQKDIVFDDEIEEERIEHNYCFFMGCIVEMLKSQNTFTLRDLNEYLRERYSERILANGDYYSFMIHLCQKKEYHLGEGGRFTESFLDAILAKEYAKGESIEFSIELAQGQEEDMIEIGNICRMTNITFTRTDNKEE